MLIGRSRSAIGDRTQMNNFGLVAVNTMGAAVYMLLPILVGTAVDSIGLSIEQAGTLASADMLGASLSAGILAFFIPRHRWRFILTQAIILLAVVDVLCAFSKGYAFLFSLRVTAGLAEGVLLSASTAEMGAQPSPERLYALAVAFQSLFGALAFYLAPVLLTPFGSKGIFFFLAGMTALCFAVARYIRFAPAAAPAAGRIQGKHQGIGRPSSLVGLVALMVSYMGQGGAWAYLDRIGVFKHLALSSIAQALALSSFAGFFGGLASSWLATRLGRLTPLLCHTVVLVVCLRLLDSADSALAFGLVASMLMFSWTALGPYLVGTLAEVDPSLKTVALSSAVILCGLALGPFAAGFTIAHFGYGGLSWVAGAMFLGSSAMFCLLNWSCHVRSRFA
jgi:predicted MFS family arabinose efflux permease